MIKKENPKLRVVIYLRLSEEDQNKINKNDASESIKNQRNLLLEEISKNETFLLVDEYCDEDLSGAGTYRPEFERMIQDCEKGKIDIVLSKNQSRFSRDMEIIEKYLHNKFIEWNVRFISLADSADTANIGNKKARQINGLVNEWYLEDVSNNIRSAFQAKMKQGEYISPFSVFGYEISKENNNQLVVDPYAGEIVKEIFNLYINGLGYTGIAKELNQKKIPSPSYYKYQKGCKLNIVSSRLPQDIKWSSSAIKKILNNEIYLGHLVQGKRTTVSYKNKKIQVKKESEWIRFHHAHEPIIAKETWNKVNREFNIRKRSCKKNSMVHLFSGKVYCSECHHTFTKKNSSKHDYLVCSSTKNGYNECSNINSIRYDTLEELILNKIQDIIQVNYSPSDLCDLLNKSENVTWNLKKENLDVRKKSIEKQLDKIILYLKSIYRDKLEQKITTLQFNKLLDSYQLEQEQLELQLEKVNHKIENMKMSYTENNWTVNKIKEICKFQKLNKVIVDEFIEKIYVGKKDNTSNNRKVKIIWNL